MKYGIIYEATAATGDRHTVRTKRPTMRANGYTANSPRSDFDKQWVLVEFMDSHGGCAHIHRDQLRCISNDA